MINLRYHIVSLIAVFLALGIGVMAGSTVVDQGIVKVLRGQTGVLRDQRDRAVEARRHQEDVVKVWEGAAGATFVDLMADRLSGVPIVVMAELSAPDALVEEIGSAVTAAGGIPAGVLRFTSPWLDADEDMRTNLATVVGSEPDDAVAEAANALSARLARPAEVKDDLLEGLIRKGFITLDRGDASGAFPPAGSMIVYLTGADEQVAPSHGGFAIPFLSASLDRLLVAVAEPLGAVHSLTEDVRATTSLATRIATVDHADTVPGRYALVEDLHDILRGGRASHHGIRRRTDGVVPTR